MHRFKHQVAILSIHAMSILDERIGGGSIGGAEKRAVLFAQMFKELGSVALVVGRTAESGTVCPRVINGLSIFYHDKYHMNGGVRKVIFQSNLRAKLADKWSTLKGRPPKNMTDENRKIAVSVYENCDAQVYCAFGATDPANELAAYCLRKNRHFVLFVATELDFDFLDEDSGRDTYNSSRNLKRQTFQSAKAVFVQTLNQKHLLKEGLGIDGFLVRNPIHIPSESQPPAKEFFLWIGKSVSTKNPMAFVTLAKQCPQLRFVMVMNRSDEVLHREVVNTSPHNLEILEIVPPQKMTSFYGRAFALVSTSLSEGFPNTFLEACLQQIPVISLNVNPDNIITEHGFGRFCHGDCLELVHAVESIYEDADDRSRMGALGRRYVMDHHSYDGVARQLKETFKSLLTSF